MIVLVDVYNLKSRDSHDTSASYTAVVEALYG